MSHVFLRMKNISKDFPGVKALDKVNIEFSLGEVHAIVGANGAGKSTLINILAGVYKEFDGEIYLNNINVNITRPYLAQKHGISLVPQQIDLFENLNIAENIFIGQEPFLLSKFGVIDRKRMISESHAYLNMFGMRLDPRLKMNILSPLEQRVIEIIKVLHRKSKVVILDEPTADLSIKETKILYSIIKRLASNNIAVIFISHRFEDIFNISDRVTVLRDGKKVFENDTIKTNEKEIISFMLGKGFTDINKTLSSTNSSIILSICNLNNTYFKNIHFDLHSGETLGILTRPGSRDSEILRYIFEGKDICLDEIRVNGNRIDIKKPYDAIHNGIGFLSDNKLLDSLFPLLSVKENMNIPYLRALSKFGIIKEHEVKKQTVEKTKELDIKVSDFDQSILTLSGGNQQKVILARWLINKNTKVFFFEEPTKGVDIGAKVEIYNIISKVVKNTCGCIIISQDLDEVLLLCDRLLLMENGKIVNTVYTRNTSKANLLSFILGEEVAN